MFKRNSSNMLLIFGAGLIAGWLVKRFFDSAEFQSHREKIMATAEELRHRLEDTDQAARVKEIFGKTSREATRMYQETRESLINELDTLKLSFDEIDKQKYVGIVTELMKTVRQEKQLPEDQVERLSRALINDFNKLRSQYQQLKTTQRHIADEVEQQLSEA